MSIFSKLDAAKDAPSPLVAGQGETPTQTDASGDKFSAVPDVLKRLTQWLMWRLEQRGTKATKVPYQQNGTKAKSNDPSTWSTYSDCLAALEKGGFDGIGFAFKEGDGLTAIDIDHCYTPDGQLEPWAQEIIDHFPNAYIEKSPSGDGLHIWCFGLPVKTGQRKWERQSDGIEQGIEVYNHRSARYLTITGSAIQLGEPGDCQGGFDWLYQEHWAEEYAIPPEATISGGKPHIEQVKLALTFIPSDNYETWINVGHALKAAGIEVGTWADWSSGSAKYIAGECERRWPGLRPSKITLGTLFHYAKQHGFTFSVKAETKDKAVEAIDWTNPETFGEPLLFGEINTPELDSDFLPPAVRDYVNAVAAHTQMPRGPIAMLALAVMAACIQKRYEVCPLGDDYREPLSLWTLVALPPASRKTAVLKALKEPVIEWEEQRAQAMAPEIERQKAEQAIAKERILKLTKQASGAEEVNKDGK